MRLPIAPRPIEGEGLSSWTARLAAHNFVDPTAFWSWLDVGAIDDVAPLLTTIGQLAEAAGLPITEIAALAARGGSLRPGWSLNAHDHGLREAACPSCCRDAADAGRDQWWPAESQAVMWVSCPIHRCVLAGLDLFNLTLEAGRLRLVDEEGRSLGAGRTIPALDRRLLDLESAIADAMTGEAPNVSWRERSAPGPLRSITVLTGYVLARERQRPPFAQLFDTDRTSGSHMFALDPDELANGVAILQGRSVRTRRNVLVALVSLLSKPAALTGELAEALQWRTAPDHRGPFRVLADHIGEFGRSRLRADLARLPTAIAESAETALDRATAELG